MILIGLVLLIVSVIFGLDLLWKNTFPVQDPMVFGQALGIHTARGFFLLGVITGAVVLLGISLILAGMRRKGSKALQRRRDKKEAGKTKESRDELAAENSGLRHELDEQHTTPPPATQRPTTPPEQNPRAGATRAEH